MNLSDMFVNWFYRMIRGGDSLVTQTSREAANKLGLEWEASRRITGVSSGDKLYSVLVVGGTYPIDLKSRVLGATGSGVVGRIYELEAADIESFDTPDSWYNMRFDLADPASYQPEAKIYTESNVNFTGGVTAESLATEARKRGADLILETNSQNNAKGATAESLGADRILYTGKIALLEIQSLDSQNISARIEIYEGKLGLPYTGD